MWGGVSALAVATGPSLGSILIDAGGWRWASSSPPRRPRRRHRRPPGRTRVGGRRSRSRPRRRRPTLGGGGGPRPGHHPGRRLGLVQRSHHRRVRGRRGSWPHRHPPVDPPRRTRDRPRRVPLPDRRARQRRHVPLLGRLLRDAAGQRALPDLGLELLDPGGGTGHHARTIARRRPQRSGRTARGTRRLRAGTRRRWPYLRRRAPLLRHDRRRRSRYLTHWLPGALLVGVGVALSFPVLSAAAVAGLPQERFGTGGAINQTARQLGAVLGVALLIAIVGTPASVDVALDRFRIAWMIGPPPRSARRRSPRSPADLTHRGGPVALATADAA